MISNESPGLVCTMLPALFFSQSQFLPQVRKLGLVDSIGNGVLDRFKSSVSHSTSRPTRSN